MEDDSRVQEALAEVQAYLEAGTGARVELLPQDSDDNTWDTYPLRIHTDPRILLRVHDSFLIARPNEGITEWLRRERVPQRIRGIRMGEAAWMGHAGVFAEPLQRVEGHKPTEGRRL